MKPTHKFNTVLFYAIEEGLSIMCSSAARSVLFFLENDGAIKSESDIASLERFSEGLESIFGFGSKVIEKKILEVLCTRLHLPQPTEISEDFELVKEVGKIFRLYEASRSTSSYARVG